MRAAVVLFFLAILISPEFIRARRPGGEDQLTGTQKATSVGDSRLGGHLGLRLFGLGLGCGRRGRASGPAAVGSASAGAALAARLAPLRPVLRQQGLGVVSWGAWQANLCRLSARKEHLPRQGTIRPRPTPEADEFRAFRGGTTPISCRQNWRPWLPRWAKDRDRGEPRGSAPPTPPYVRVRIRRFEKLR